MKILVTGGGGCVGSHIVNNLDQHEVLSVDDLSSGKLERISIPNKKVDIKNTQELLEIFKSFNPDVVIHTAAQVMARESLDKPFFDAQTNILGTISILECCKQTNVKKVIYTSTGGACYGEPISLPVSEDAPKFPLSPYGASKYAAEKYIHLYSYLHNFDYLIFRFGNVFGTHDDPKTNRVTSVFITKLLNNEECLIFGDGHQTRDFLYATDIAKTVAQYVDKPTPSKIYNLASGQSVSVNQIYQIITEHLNINKPAKHVEAIKGEIRDITLDVSKAKKELGWNPTPFEQAMKETIDWFNQQ